MRWLRLGLASLIRPRNYKNQIKDGAVALILLFKWDGLLSEKCL